MKRHVTCAVLATFAAAAGFAENPAVAANCSNTSVGLVPINDLGTARYQGFEGGLYPGGSNRRPDAHTAGGLRAASHIQPRDRNGNPDPNGKIVVMTFGYSNTAQESDWLLFFGGGSALRNPSVQLVNGGIPGLSADRIVKLGALPTPLLNAELTKAGVTEEQVQVIWYKQAVESPTGTFPDHAETLRGFNEWILQQLKIVYPNLQIAYMSTRAYGGYGLSGVNPEPYAYETGFSYKWLIEQQINGDPALNYDPALGPVKAPWISWGPYLWADGETPRADGWFWRCSDFQSDGTHPSFLGAVKVGGQVARFFERDPTSVGWYLAAPPATGVDVLPESGWTVGAARPNPFGVRMAVPVRIDEAERVEAAVYSLDGRRVRSLHSGELPAGAHEITWDGRDSRGRSAPAGVYLVRIDNGRDVRTVKTTLLR